jgi:hypothetical protein
VTVNNPADGSGNCAITSHLRGIESQSHFAEYVIRQIEFDPSSVSNSEPSRATATPAGRPQTCSLSTERGDRQDDYSRIHRSLVIVLPVNGLPVCQRVARILPSQKGATIIADPATITR